ncbi:MAG: hypothetical protein WA364_17900, partial [Candidatus Nitrosopolaris sp.]
RLGNVSDAFRREKFFADTNCTKVSHVLCHEVLRMIGKKRKEYFDSIHDLWRSHKHKDLQFIYYNDRFKLVSKESSYRYVTIDIKHIL